LGKAARAHQPGAAPMLEQSANLFVAALAIYALLGALFALAFIIFGLSRLDSEAKGSGWSFRAIIFPGVVAFWPLLLSRWMRGVIEPPTQKDPHR
jgi:hypothetical protein